MKTTPIIFLTLLLLCSCLKRKDHLTHERGYVIATQYVPDTRDTEVGTGISSNGSMVITTCPVGKPEQYIIIFKCEHQNIFATDNREVFAKVSKGDVVDISYYEMVDDEGVVKDYDFIDANKINP